VAKYANKEAAEKHGEEIRQMMANPDQWKVQVWENLGWHCAIDCGPVHVWPSVSKDSFNCLIAGNDNHPGSGDGRWSTKGKSGKTPEEAVRIEMASVFAYKNAELGRLADIEAKLAAIELKDPELPAVEDD